MIYPVDSAIQRLNNRGQVWDGFPIIFFTITERFFGRWLVESYGLSEHSLMTVEMTWRKFFLSHAIFQETSPEMDVENCQCHGKKTNIQHFSMLYTLIDHKNDVKPLARFVNILTPILW